MRPLRLTSDRLTLSAPSDFVKDWLVRRFARRIEETLEQFLGRPVVLGFQIVPEGSEAKLETSAPAAKATKKSGRILPDFAQSPDDDAELDEAPATHDDQAPARDVAADAPEPTKAATAAAKKAARADAKLLEDFEDFSSPLNKK